MFGWINSLFRPSTSSRGYDISARPGAAWVRIMWGSGKSQDILREMFQSTGLGQKKIRDVLLVPNPESEHGRTVVEVHIDGHIVGNIGWDWSSGIFHALKGRTCRVDGRIISKNQSWQGRRRYYEVELSFATFANTVSIH